jgi:isopenicillin N synthase-like dioxygenase
MTDLAGLWHRLLISFPGRPVDTLTEVDWLQGPGLYVDLRQPHDLPEIQARCLAELTLDDCRALARQEAFAGALRLSGGADGLRAEWLREIDFQPANPLGDKGRLESHGDLLIEHGIAATYVEHWQRPPAMADAPCWAARLAGSVPAILVRHANHFAWARARATPLPAGTDLADHLTGLATAQSLVDCEVSLGTITDRGWLITRSTHPWRPGTLLLAETSPDTLTINDLTPTGGPYRRPFTVAHCEGTPAFTRQPTAPSPPLPASVLPVIDIAALGGGDAGAEAAAVASIREAAAQTGFLAITGHGIAPAVADRLRAAARNYFALPLETKLAQFIGNSTNHRGYVPEGEELLTGGTRDRKEAFDLALDLPAGSVPPGHPMLGPNQWPALPGFREDVMAWYAAAYAVGRRLLRGFALALGQPPELLGRLVTAPPSQLRLIHYPHDPHAVDVPGMGAHTDYECFTLLLSTAPGLEVMTQSGEWIDAPPVPGALIVNIGDMFEFWSGGRFVATSHRVRKVAEERYSFPLFFALDYDTQLLPPDPAAGEAVHEPIREPIRTGEHLYAQTVQTFRYLQARAAAGRITLPENARPPASFGQHARHPSTPDRST